MERGWKEEGSAVWKAARARERERAGRWRAAGSSIQRQALVDESRVRKVVTSTRDRAADGGEEEEERRRARGRLVQKKMQKQGLGGRMGKGV